jgi:hypothetical protein
MNEKPCSRTWSWAWRSLLRIRALRSSSDYPRRCVCYDTTPIVSTAGRFALRPLRTQRQSA